MLTLFILIWFTHQKRRGKIQTGKIMSTKVCQRFLYSIPTLVQTWGVWLCLPRKRLFPLRENALCHQWFVWEARGIGTKERSRDSWGSCDPLPRNYWPKYKNKNSLKTIYKISSILNFANFLKRKITWPKTSTLFWVLECSTSIIWSWSLASPSWPIFKKNND